MMQKNELGKDISELAMCCLIQFWLRLHKIFEATTTTALQAYR